MDIWDLSRLLMRRWPVSLPLLLLAAAAAAVTAFNVRPDYVGTTYVSLLPPTAQRNAVVGQTLTVNPWDTERLTNAVVVRLNTRSFAEQIEREGITGTVEAGVDERYRSVIRIRSTSATEAQARATLSRLLDEVDDEVSRQQAKYPNLGPADKITTTRLGSGEDVEISTGRIKRATVVMAAIGLLLTAAVTSCVDAALRRRTRRRSGIAAVRQPPSAVAPQPADRGLARVGTAPAPGADTDATQPVRITNVPLQMPIAGAAPAELPALADYAAKETESSQHGAARMPDDSTIVLPFSNAPWAGRPKNAPVGDGDAGKTAGTVQR